SGREDGQMKAFALLEIYSIANLLLLASLGTFLGLKNLTRKLRVSLSHSQLIQIAKALLILSCLSPFVFHEVPKNQLPRVQWGFFEPASEMGHRVPQMPAGGKNQARPPTARVSSDLAQLSHQWPVSSEQLSFAALIALLAGVILMLGRFLFHLRKLQTVLQSVTVIRFVGKVCVGVSEEITIPFSARFGRLCWVALPSQMLGKSNDFRIALQHELQHHRQGDTLWAILMELMICFFFPNPFVYFWKKELNELQEFSCDEALIGRKRISSYEYGSCLVRVAETALGSRQMYVGTTCMAADSKNPAYFKSFLRRRIEMFTSHDASQVASKANRWAGVVLGTVTGLMTIAIALGAEQSIRQTNENSVNEGKVIVDPEIQKIADSVLSRFLAKEKAKAGFAIVADPMTGKILAVANVDTTQKLSGYWALGELFEPASVLKSLVVAEALNRGLTTPDEKISCENGKYRYGDRVYHDWHKAGWDHLTTTQTIALSSDICSIKLGERIGAQGLMTMLENFGFGPEGTAKNFPAARSGRLPSKDDPEHPRLVPYVSEGAGLDISPIEMVQAFGAIANGGKLMKPLPANASDSDSQVIRRVLSPEAAEKTKMILQQVVLTGTASPHGESKLYTTAGKTATSHYPRFMPFDGDPDYANFIGFAPVKNPRVEVYVGIRDPESKDGAHGSSHATPVFKEIAEAVLQHMKVAPDMP
ncbi:MAG: penicillin-binding transpeptidase domain-containing protein, partial [Bdellovibrionia bacterium]